MTISPALYWYLLPFFFVSLVVPEIYAQGFRLFSARNHPEIEWRVAETEHFRLVHPKRLDSLAALAAPIAERSYRALSKNLNVHFDDKIRIYFTDTDDIVNGFAVPIGGGYTNIWVHQTQVAEGWTGPVKWLRKVIAHELAHIFHYRATRSSLGLLQYIFANPTPSFWAEGLAQYETEQWDAFRGERWLRTAVLEDELSYEDGSSIWNGALRYAVGNAQVRYLAEQYGDSTITNILEHRSPALFGLFEVHDFSDAFEATVGQSYRSFYNEWQRHVNIYYNTIAGQVGRLDSLGTEPHEADPIALPGQYLYDVAYVPGDTSRAAVLALTSLERPVKRLYVLDEDISVAEGDTSRSVDVEIVAEGAIAAPVAWDATGERLVYARRARGPHGSLLYDLFLVDVEAVDERRLTFGRRAYSPVFVGAGPQTADRRPRVQPNNKLRSAVRRPPSRNQTSLRGAGGDAAISSGLAAGPEEIAALSSNARNDVLFIGSEGGTGNVFLIDLSSGKETQLTHFTGDVQLSSVRVQPGGDLAAIARFAADGSRNIVLLDLTTGEIRPLDNPPSAVRRPPSSPPSSIVHRPSSNPYIDNRRPIWRPDGSQLAYTSLRDGVPNIFVYDLASGLHRRVTHLATGATATDWLPSDSTYPEGRLIAVTSVSKSTEEAYPIPAGRAAPDFSPQPPEGYAGWTNHRPPHTIPNVIPPDPSLIQATHAYDTWGNIEHVGSLALPYYLGPDDWGIFGASLWTEPLGKHRFIGGGALSAGKLGNSVFFAGYVNNQFAPTLSLSAYRLPRTARLYDDGLLVERLTGGDFTAEWPLDVFAAPYTASRVQARLRYVDVHPIEKDGNNTPTPAPTPEAGQQADIRLAFAWKKQRPWRRNALHPLDGMGIRAQLTGALPVLGADTKYVRGILDAYTIFPALGAQRVYLYGRAAAQMGEPFAQNYLGLARYDVIDLQLGPLTFGGPPRVRGFRELAVGDALLFGTLEYRMPFINLGTSVLDLVALGPTALALFADGGMVWTESSCTSSPHALSAATICFGDGMEARLGLGIELKNRARVLGFEFTHAIGIAQPAAHFGTGDDVEIYYRIGSVAPF